MRGGISPLPNTPSWRGAQLIKAQGQFYLCLYVMTVYGVMESLFTGTAVICVKVLDKHFLGDITKNKPEYQGPERRFETSTSRIRSNCHYTATFGG